MEELEVIVQRMIDAGESEDNIKLVIEEYTNQIKSEDVAKTDAVVVDATPPADMVSASEGGSLESFVNYGELTKEDTKRKSDLIESGEPFQSKKEKPEDSKYYRDYKNLELKIDSVDSRLGWLKSLDTPNEEEITSVTNIRAKLSESQKENVDKLISPVFDRELGKFYEDGIAKDEYIEKNFYGFNVPNLDKINEDADKLFTDESLKSKYKSDITSSIQFSIDIPKESLKNKVNSVYKEKFGNSLNDDISKDQQAGFDEKYGKALNESYVKSQSVIANTQKELSKETEKLYGYNQARINEISNNYRVEVENLKSTEPNSQEDVDRINTSLNNVRSEYVKSVDSIIQEQLLAENNYSTRLNRLANKKLESYNKLAKEYSAKYSKEYGINDKIKSQIDKASAEAVTQLYKISSVAKQGLIEANPAVLNRVVTSTLSSFGGVMQGVATAFGGDGEYGEKLEQFFQPAVSPIKSFKDVTLYSLSESTGNLIGSMLPSMAASIAAGIVTKNASLTTRIIATGAAGWVSETIDMSGRAYKDALERTGSKSEALNSASQTIDAQIILAPTYLAEGLPFIGAFKKIANPVLRIGTGAVVEYGSELLQEYPQGIMESSIQKTGSFENFPQFSSKKALTETALNILPVILMGGAGAINKEEVSILESHPDIAFQQLSKLIDSKDKNFANLEISQLYSSGAINKKTFEYLGNTIESYNESNSLEYNAIKFKRDQVERAANNEQDEVKKKIFKENVRAYDELMANSIKEGGVNLGTVNINGSEYINVPNNPITYNEQQKETTGEANLETETETTEQPATDVPSDGQNNGKKVGEDGEVDAKKANIEKRRQEELDAHKMGELLIPPMSPDGKGGWVLSPEAIESNKKEVEINDKYDAELAALEPSQQKGKGVEQEGEVKLNSLPKSQIDKGLSVLNNIKDENKKLTLNELADVYEAMGVQDSEFITDKGLTAKGLKDVLTSEESLDTKQDVTPKAQEGKPVPSVSTMATEDVKVDAKRFQFKDGTDKEGATDKLKGRKYNPELAGVISVWKDPENGETYVINGHHRLALAKENGVEVIDVRNIKAKNAGQARFIGAIQNIAQGQGTDIDAAKVFRESGDNNQSLKDKGVSLSDSKARNGLALANLSEDLFKLITKGTLKPSVGVIIGENINDKDIQEQFYNILKGKNNISNATIKIMAQDINDSKTETVEVVDLFGTTKEEFAKYEDRAKLISGIRTVLGKVKNLLGKVAKNEDLLSEYGNEIDVAKSEGVSKEAAIALGVFDKLRNTNSTIKNIIDNAVKRIENGESKSKVRSDTAKQLTESIPKILEGGVSENVGSSDNAKGKQRKPKEEVGGKKTTTESKSPDKPKKPQTPTQKVLSKFGKGRFKGRVLVQVENATKALAKIAPNVKIIVYNTEKEYYANIKSKGKSRGDYSGGVISINLEIANLKTVAHEVFHALLLKDGITNKKARELTSDMLKAVKKVASPELLKELNDFAELYKETPLLQSEESIAQLFGILAENYESSPQSVKDIINKWLNKLAKALNVPVENILGSDKDVLDFLNVVSAKVASGEVIEQSDVKILKSAKAKPDDKATRQQRTTRLAPNGNQSNLTDVQYDIVRTPAFKNWFGNWETDPKNASKIVDRNGEPMVSYHGSAADFDVFDKKKLGSLTNTEIAKVGFFFASNKRAADQYAFIGGLQNPYLENKLTEARAFFLNIKNPYKGTNKEWNDLLNWASDGSRKYDSPTALKKANKEFKEFLLKENFDGVDFDNGLEIVAFEPTQAKLADGTNTTFDPDAPSNRQQKFDGEDNFSNWKGDNKEYSGSEIQDVKTGEPVVLRGYHGTTNEFYEFDANQKGNVEGHLGKVNYFTSDYQDASANYQSDGGDLTSRIEQEKERIDQYIEDDLGIPTLESKIKLLSESDKNLLSSELGLEITKEIGELNVNELPEFLASKELKGEDEKVLDLYIKLNNPAVIGKGMNYIEVIPESLYEDSIEDAAQEIAEENDVTIEEAKEDFSYEVKLRAIDIEGIENPFVEALQEAINENTYDYGESVNASEILDDFIYDDEINLNQLEKTVREGVSFSENEEGKLTSSQIVADMFKNLGYDGVILQDVSNRFKNMGIGPSTSHIHVFNEFSNQIKLADGTNVTFNPDTKDFRYQLQEDYTIQDVIAESKKEGLSRKETIDVLKELGFTIDEIRKDFKKDPESVASDSRGVVDTGTKKVDTTKPKKQTEPKGKSKEKTIVKKRAYDGAIREDVRIELEKLGLNRTELKTQKEVSEAAEAFIEKWGDELALEAVKEFDVRGAVAFSILPKLIKRLQNKADRLKSTDVNKLKELAKKEAEISNLLGEEAYIGGSANAQLAYEYQTLDLGWNVESKINEFKKENGGKIPENVEKRFRDLDVELKEIRKKTNEAEEREIEQEEKDLLQNIIDAADRAELPKQKKTYINNAVNSIKELRRSIKANNYSDATGIVAIIDSGLLAIQKSLEAGVEVSEAIEKGITYIKAKLKSKGVDKWEKESEFRRDVNSHLSKGNVEAGSVTVNEDGDIDIPLALLKDLIIAGNKDIESLSKAVLDILKEDNPNVTLREVRDTITGYGKTRNINKDEISKQLSKMRRMGRLISGLEDVANKKRPLRTGLQREKILSDERAKKKELREAMKGLPIDLEANEKQLKTLLESEKQRLRNKIEDLQSEIDKGKLVPRSSKARKSDAELNNLKEKRDAVKLEHDNIFKDEEFKNKKRLEITKRNLKNAIADRKRRLKTGDFSKNKRKPLIVDSELTRLKREALRVQEEYDKEFYKYKLLRRKFWTKTSDTVLDAWGLTRALRATGEFSFVLIQGGLQTISHPRYAAKAFKRSMKFLASEKKTQDWLRTIKAQIWYPELYASGLGLTDLHAEVSAREELFFSDWITTVWDFLMRPTKLFGDSAYKKAQEFSPFKMVERAAVGYLDTVRVLRYLDGKQMLEEQGTYFEDNPQAYKEMADVINTFTGRGSLGVFEKHSKILTQIFFSPRNWASVIKTATPYAFYHFGKMRAGAKGKYKPSVAQKMALSDFSKYVGVTASIVAMFAIALNGDDDEETGVELDPRSSDFGKIKIGNVRFDPWGGRIQQVVFIARFYDGHVKKNGELIPLGTKYKAPSRFELTQQQALNKLAPSAAMVAKWLATTPKTPKELRENTADKNGDRKTPWGEDYSLSGDILKNLYPIYAETINELIKDEGSSGALDGIGTFFGLFGGGVNVYDSKKKKKNKKKEDTGRNASDLNSRTATDLNSRTATDKKSGRTATERINRRNAK